MPPKLITFDFGKDRVEAYITVSAYSSPQDPYRLNVQLTVPETHPMFERMGPNFAIVSNNMPDMPNPGPRQFYFKTWSENQGLMESMVKAGAIRVVDPAGIPVNAWGSKAYQVELLWPDSDMEVSIPTAEELTRAAEDWKRFFSNTYTMHLGM